MKYLLITFVLALVGFTAGAVSIITHMPPSMGEAITSDCRLTHGCGPDVIQSFCAPSPAACPNVARGDEGQSPAVDSPAYLMGER